MRLFTARQIVFRVKGNIGNENTIYVNLHKLVINRDIEKINNGKYYTYRLSEDNQLEVKNEC